MQTVLLFAAKAASVAATAGRAVITGAKAVGHAVMGSSAAATSTAAGGAKAATTASTILKAARVGTSVVSALSSFAQSRQEAASMENQAFNETLQANQEFIQSQERANSIMRDYNAVVQDQMAVAYANGLDISSGSVVEARQDAQVTAGRQLAIDRNTTTMNATLRKGRAAYLRNAASQSKGMGFLTGAAKAGQAFIDLKKVG